LPHQNLPLKTAEKTGAAIQITAAKANRKSKRLKVIKAISNTNEYFFQNLKIFFKMLSSGFNKLLLSTEGLYQYFSLTAVTLSPF